jgi:hypothetical protein
VNDQFWSHLYLNTFECCIQDEQQELLALLLRWDFITGHTRCDTDRVITPLPDRRGRKSNHVRYDTWCTAAHGLLCIGQNILLHPVDTVGRGYLLRVPVPSRYDAFVKAYDVRCAVARTVRPYERVHRLYYHIHYR